MPRLVPRLFPILLTAALTAAGGIALAQDRVIDSSVSIEQDDLAAGVYTVNEVVQAGRQFFSKSYLPADGHGEGNSVTNPNRQGPKFQKRIALWPDVPGVAEPYIPFLRLDGLDSQSCFACHNTSGTYVPPGEIHEAQKPFPVGGAGEFASVLFGNSTFPQPLTHIVRVPPRAFGSAYLQELALEMTDELLADEAAATQQASLNPGTPVTRALDAKGLGFGAITITCSDSNCTMKTRDTSGVDGVSPDLIVRPLQNKGVAATVRSFTKTALRFHHSLEPVEIVGINTDCDKDGKINEMSVENTALAAGVGSTPVQQSLGNVAALTAFTGMLRPPVSPPVSISADAAAGSAIFDQIGCNNCHVRALDTRPDPQFRIELAEPAGGCPPEPAQLGSFAEANAEVHPAVRAVQAAKIADTRFDPFGSQLGIGAQTCPNGFYCIDLTNPGSLPPEFGPRIPANKDGTVTVPLYSDLRRHDLGVFLAQSDPEQEDDAGNPIDNQEYLTQKLWGVRDNGPWLHDGRARTLDEAILMHAGRTGTDSASDAFQAVRAYRQDLTPTQRQQLIAFLESLTVPNP